MKYVKSSCVASLLLAALALGAQPADSSVTEIGQERTACFGTCPVYTVTIKSDGTFSYHGKEYTTHKGDWTGHLEKDRFPKLAHLIAACDFPTLKDNYTQVSTDLPSVNTTAVIDGKARTIRDYGHAAPKELLEIETEISAALDHASWDEQKK